MIHSGMYLTNMSTMITLIASASSAAAEEEEEVAEVAERNDEARTLMASRLFNDIRHNCSMNEAYKRKS